MNYSSDYEYVVSTWFDALGFISSSLYSCIVASWTQYILSIVIICIIACKWLIHPIVVLSPTPATVTLSSRVYALWKGHWIILTVYFLVMCGNIANYLFIFGGAMYHGVPYTLQQPFTGCGIILTSPIMWVIFANTLTFEALSIGLIVYKAWPIARQRGIQTPLFTLLLEDGIGYYLTFTASKLCIVGAIYAPTALSPVVLPTFFSVPVAAIAINRLFIRLQRIMFSKQTTTSFTLTNFSTLHYPPTHSGSGGGRGSGNSGPKEITTFGGSDPSGQRRRLQQQQRDQKRERDEIFSDVDDIELSSGDELRRTSSTHQGTTLSKIPTGESVAVTIESDQHQHQGHAL